MPTVDCRGRGRAAAASRARRRRRGQAGAEHHPGQHHAAVRPVAERGRGGVYDHGALGLSGRRQLPDREPAGVAARVELGRRLLDGDDPRPPVGPYLLDQHPLAEQ
ncbi:hypothetical protein [Phytohabitans rumicis]|uniref:hypothetical protein n=1 Tax=Phytohabitans rumicis TaxID=1076125 RepID=UPI001FE72101|nr:hypothetical protein [Phytohabitans rumicis]